ncbi:hypothetical protein CHH49_04035 [Terribacillus saccharophilus]|nr:hypothetical protein CHH49_04035 [Terribacillus saccharophilus]
MSSISVLLIALFFYSLTLDESSSSPKETPDETVSTTSITTTWANQYIGNISSKNQSKSTPIKVAILDSGIDKSHDALKHLQFDEYNVLDPNNKIEDEFNHGTAIASLIASVFTDDKEQSLLKLYDVKVINSKGAVKTEDVIKGIEWSINQDVDLINLSLGFTSDEPALKQVIQTALDNDITVVASSGNTLSLDVDYPARYNGVLSISAINENEEIFEFTGSGKVDFVAPGVEVLAASNDNTFKDFTGTSFATAYATGIIAKVNISDPDLSSKNTLDVITSKYTLDLGEPGKDSLYGFGALKLKGDN